MNIMCIPTNIILTILLPENINTIISLEMYLQSIRLLYMKIGPPAIVRSCCTVCVNLFTMKVD